MKEYVCYTNIDKWTFHAEDDIDAMHVALYYCYIDREEFIKIEYGLYLSRHKALRICLIDDKNNIYTLWSSDIESWILVMRRFYRREY